MTGIFISAIVLVAASIGATYLVKQMAIRKQIMDTPNERSSHTVPTPRGGGLAVAILWYSTLVLLAVFGKIEISLFAALLSGSILSVVSFIDDVKGLSPAIRFLAQLVTSVLALWFLGGLNVIQVGEYVHSVHWIFLIIVVIGFLWMINLFNFLDGIDGYLGAEGIFVLGTIFLFTYSTPVLFFVAILLGFLFWNWPKAKIFSGDIGSTLIGFTITVFAIYYQNTQQLSLFIPIVLSGLFWFDATLTLYRRWRNKEKLSEAHKKHTYQRLNQSGLSHRQVVFMGMVVNVILCCCSCLIYFHPSSWLYAILGALGVLSGYMIFADKRMPFK